MKCRKYKSHFKFWATAILVSFMFSPASGQLVSVDTNIEPTVSTAPNSVEELPCLKTQVALPKAMLVPTTKPMQMPNFSSVKMRTGIARQAQLDPAGVCRYRDSNRALPHATAKRVIFLGDSITDAWIVAAPDLFQSDVLDRGISGQTTTQMLMRFREDVIDLQPRVVHIMAGVNDINTPAGTALTRSNIESMVDLARAHGIQVVLASITPCSRFWITPDAVPGPRIVELNKWLRAFAARRELVYVDYWTPMQDGKLGMRADLTNEGLHPNQNGYDLMTPMAQIAITSAMISGGQKRY